VERTSAEVENFLEMKRWSLERMIRPVLKQIKLGSGARILDVGCGPGAFLDIASAYGLEAYGVEIGTSSWELANFRHPHYVHLGDLNSAAFKDDFFDLVTMFDVIEHLQDPVATLTEVRRVLAPDGWFFVLTPDISSISSRLMHSHWYQYKPNEHLFYFSPRSLGILLHLTGFHSVHVSTVGIHTDLGRILCVSAGTNPHLNVLFRLLIRRRGLEQVRVWIPSGHLAALAKPA
jgi:SAM-dependent methyltransferase